jgi:regulator of sigma E protease
MLGSLKQIFKGQAKSDDIAGPVGIMKLLNSQAKAGIFSLLSFIGFLSLNLAIMNMMPFPPLDGGNILCDSIEAVTTRKLPKMILIAVKTVFVLCLLAILVFTFFNDLSN